MFGFFFFLTVNHFTGTLCNLLAHAIDTKINMDDASPVSHNVQ